MKKTILLLCGGQSGEHKVSLRSAISIIANLPTDRYNLIPVGIDTAGVWLSGDPLIINPDDPKKIQLSPHLKQVELKKNKLGSILIDCVFSVLHGRFGEDGCMQGALEMFGVPYVGSSVLGSALAMDKDITKRLVIHDQIPTAPYLTLRRSDPNPIDYPQASATLGPTLFIKPASQGSSLGVTKATDVESFTAGLALAFSFDPKIIIEKAIIGREIEVAVLGNENPIASRPGEVIVTEDFYSYEAKYILGNTKLDVPATISHSLEQKLKRTAIQAFGCLELSGLARIDFFVDAQEKIWFNETNTLPGFTAISMYAMMFAASGIPYPDLLDRLIQLALQQFQQKQSAHLVL